MAPFLNDSTPASELVELELPFDWKEGQPLSPADSTPSERVTPEEADAARLACRATFLKVPADPIYLARCLDAALLAAQSYDSPDAPRLTDEEKQAWRILRNRGFTDGLLRVGTELAAKLVADAARTAEDGRIADHLDNLLPFFRRASCHYER